MADLTKQQLIIESNNTYLNNNSGEIGADNVRAFNETLIDNTVNQADYTADSSSFDARIEAGGGGTVPAGTVSGSSQIDYPQISNIPSGIVSGSSQIDYPQISNIPSGIVSGSIQVTLEDTTFTDGTQYQVLRTDGAGNLSFDYADRAQIEVRASEAIAKGDPLYVVGFNVGQNRVEVGKADASDPSKMPAYGIAYEAVSINTNTQMVALGTLQDIDTQVTYDFQVGETVYVAVGGGLTNVKPTGTNLIQNVGIVGRRNQNNGEILVSAIGRSNDVPNIQQGYAWVGNASGVATAVATSSFAGDVPVGVATTGSNTFNGDQTISGSVTIQDTNAPMSGLVLKNNSGGGDVQIIPGGDFVTTFNDASLTGISTYGGNKISGSWGEVGKNVGGNPGAGVYNADTGGSSASSIKLVHGIGYKTFESSPNGTTNLRGDTVKVLGSSSLESGVSMTVYGDVSGSNFTGSFIGDGSQLTFGGTNLVSGSSQITDGSGLLSSSVTDFNTYSSSVDSRIDAVTTIDTGSFATTGSNTFTGDQQFGTYNLNTVGTLGTINANVSNVFAVTQSQESTIGTIVLSYPFTGSQGQTGLVAQKFSTYEGGSQFDQQISGVDFSYFKAQNGGMIFETIGSGEIKFFSAGTTQFGPTGNFTSNKMLQQSVSGYGSQINSITAPFTGSNGTLYTNSTFGLQNYGGGSGIDNAYMIEIADSSFQKYCALQVGEALTKFVIGTGGDTDFDVIELKDNNDGSSTINLKADTLNVGVQTATSINIGNDGGSNIISGSTTFSTNATIGGNTTIQGTNAAPGNTFQVNDGNGAPRLQVNNATLAGITGTNVIINGNTTLDGTVAIDDATTINGNLENTGSFTQNGDTTIVGTNLAPGNTFIAKDGNGASRLQVNNATLKGLTGVDVVINGNTTLDGIVVIDDATTINGNLENTGSFTNGGDTTIVGTNAAPAQTFIVKDGNSVGRLEVNNATLSGLVGFDVNLNGTVHITETLKMVAQNPLPAGVVGELAVSGSNLYFYNGSWTQVV
jgi:hypothetical protein